MRILIDFDKIEPRNLNRIVNSTLADAKAQRSKVVAFAEAVTSYRGKGVAVPVSASISTRGAVLCASQADVMFSCVDSARCAKSRSLTRSCRASLIRRPVP
ncbi:ThiF family adenylyltransferase [Pelomonas caseinilytica]|uniref:ThiF family adenylyltransferase n=1 Tax=Pelomonas caseinilytica TaxID=2906763 RepID=UPI003B010387